MKILVTGGAGFIGSHLCEQLLEEGHEVVCVDNLLTGSRENIAHLVDHPRFTFQESDVGRTPIEISGSLDRIYHLASPASPKSYQEFALDTIAVNTEGTRLLLELAKDKKARMLLASTSEVYGDPKEHPQKEDYWGNVNPVGPRACYDESKRLGETLVSLYGGRLGVDVRTVRIFNTYGPRLQEDDGRVVSNFVRQAVSGQPLTVYGDGTQTRSFCYVSDLVSGIIKAMETNGARNHVINLGNPEEFTVSELAQLVLRLAASDSAITHKPLPQDDPTRRRPDITKARELLSWTPSVSIEEGLKKTIDWFGKRYKKEKHA